MPCPQRPRREVVRKEHGVCKEVEASCPHPITGHFSQHASRDKPLRWPQMILSATWSSGRRTLAQGAGKQALLLGRRARVSLHFVLTPPSPRVCVCVSRLSRPHKEAGSLAGLHFHFDLVLSLPELRSLAGGAPPGGPEEGAWGVLAFSHCTLHPSPEGRSQVFYATFMSALGQIRPALCSPAVLLGAHLLQPVSMVTGKTGHKVPRCCGQSSPGTALLQRDCPRQFSTEFCPACWNLQ